MTDVPARAGVPLDRADELHLGHRNLIAASLAMAGWSAEGVRQEDDGVVMFASGSWIPLEFNEAYRTDDSVDADELVRRADAFFSARGRGFSIKVRDEGSDEDLRRACEQAGMATFSEPSPQMICRDRPRDATPAGISVRVAENADVVRDFVTVNADAYSTYGLPPEEMVAVFGQPERVLSDEVVVVVAYDGEDPLAAALTYLSDGIAGLYFVGTVARARRRGLGRCIATAATQVGFDRGGRVCILQASPMGEPIYLAMGYETLYHYVTYAKWAATAA
jgi:hypothetical protein